MSLALTFSLHFSDRIEACSNQPIGNSFTKDSVSISFMGLIEPLNFERLVLEPSIFVEELKDFFQHFEQQLLITLTISQTSRAHDPKFLMEHLNHIP